MDSLTEGPYRLRYVGPDGTEDAAGLYATRVDGVGNPITAIPSDPSLLDSENWWFAKAFTNDHWFILAQGPLPKIAGIGPVRLGFSNGVVKQGTPIVYAAGLGDYKITPVANNLYTISAATNSESTPSANNYIGKSLSGILEIQEFSAQTSDSPSIPKWCFEKVQ
ncbi:hypothetical protein RhiJN_08507 [Ceratobasidium sp. AG-Ba]|nr:hypothetical protein RhiJN_08507 [Ceratobasidium sp. AG-Ba]